MAFPPVCGVDGGGVIVLDGAAKVMPPGRITPPREGSNVNVSLPTVIDVGAEPSKVVPPMIIFEGPTATGILFTIAPEDPLPVLPEALPELPKSSFPGPGFSEPMGGVCDSPGPAEEPGDDPLTSPGDLLGKG